MKCLLILAMFAASFANAAFGRYEETRNLDIDASSLRQLEIESGSGSLTVTGDPESSEIRVTATIQVPDADDDAAKRIIEKYMQLSLARDGDKATLKGWFDADGHLSGDSPSIMLEVRMPVAMALEIEDGSGSIVVKGVGGDIGIDDGSGSVSLDDVGGRVRIEDGSGSMDIAGVHGDLSIIDGSGSIEVRDVDGSVLVDDGSGSIRVSDVTGDLTVTESGSGSVKFSQVQGTVSTDE